MLLETCEADGSLLPHAAGWRAVLTVRALHARVRQRLLRSADWKKEVSGVPVNQEDMAVTLLAFSLNVIIGCEIILGVKLPADTQQAYLHLWRYIGWLMGVDDDCNPCRSMDEARAWLQSITMHILEPDELSIRLAHHMLRAPAEYRREREGGNTTSGAMADAGLPQESAMGKRAYNSYVIRAQFTRILVGDALGDALQLPFVPTARYRARRFLLVMRVYGRLCGLPLVGGLLAWTHRKIMCAMRTLESKRFNASTTSETCPFGSFAQEMSPEFLL
ncbi:MAG: hypothetical protein SGPRY_012642 [Prymnesium sp.]